MPGMDEIIVGYRERDPMRDYADKAGGRCIACGHITYFNASAFPILSGKSEAGDHDAKIVCRTCYGIDRQFIDAAMV